MVSRKGTPLKPMGLTATCLHSTSIGVWLGNGMKWDAMIRPKKAFWKSLRLKHLSRPTTHCAEFGFLNKNRENLPGKALSGTLKIAIFGFLILYLVKGRGHLKIGHFLAPGSYNAIAQTLRATIIKASIRDSKVTVTA